MDKAQSASLSLTAPDMAREMALAKEICEQRRVSGDNYQHMSQSQPEGVVPVYLGDGEFLGGTGAGQLHRDPRGDGLRRVMAVQSRLMRFAWNHRKRLCTHAWRTATQRLRQHRAAEVRRRREWAGVEPEAVTEKRKVGSRTQELEEKV